MKVPVSLLLLFTLCQAPVRAAPVVEVIDGGNAAANGFTLVTTNNAGVIAPTTGSVRFVEGPATPPLGEGSLNFMTGPGHGDESAQLRYSGLAGTKLSLLTALSYSTYATSFNGSQLPYMNIFLDNVAGGGSDRLFFEPYQNTAEGAVAANTWQTWDVLAGMIYSDNLGLNPELFSTYLTDNPNAIFTNNLSLPTIRLQSGRANPTDNFNTNVDGLVINNTAFDFEAVPELDANTATGAFALSLGLLLLAGDRRKRV